MAIHDAMPDFNKIEATFRNLTARTHLGLLSSRKNTTRLSPLDATFVANVNAGYWP
jgi:hypothetical protein